MQPTLYHLEYCPYCHRVLRAADQLGLDLKLVEITQHPEAKDRLFKERGRGTVPVLGIPTKNGEVLLGESSDIIDWLRDNASSLKKAS